MKKVLAAVLVYFLALSLFTVAQAVEQEKKEAKKEAKKEEKVQREYVGVSKCGMCHKSKARGDQLGQWEATKHANAYNALATDAAKEAGKKAGIEGDPQKSPKCLKCHVTAYGVDKELLGAKYKIEDGVGCESCHGPGGDYVKMAVMKDREKAIEAGLVVPTEEVCVTCHNKESPTFVKFDFEKMWPKVAHPRPKAEK